jgi:hypothetical protein
VIWILFCQAPSATQPNDYDDGQSTFNRIILGAMASAVTFLFFLFYQWFQKLQKQVDEQHVQTSVKLEKCETSHDKCEEGHRALEMEMIRVKSESTGATIVADRMERSFQKLTEELTKHKP